MYKTTFSNLIDVTEWRRNQKKADSEGETFTVPFTLTEKQEHISISPNSSSKPSKEQIINQAFKFH